MEISEFTLKILLLFLPGILCSIVVDTFTIHKDRTNFQFIILSFVYGVSSYLFYYAINSILPDCLSVNSNKLYFVESLINKNSSVSMTEVICTCVIAIALGFLWTAIQTHKLHFRIVTALGVTKKFGELDVWGFLMNSSNVEWVTVRDKKNNLMYDGWVQAFSDNSKEAELLLGDVKVYNNDTGSLLYEVAVQYLSLDRSNISIEIRRFT